LDNPDYLNYSKLIINSSDGVILGSPVINPGVTSYIEKTGKAMLPFQVQDDYVDAYSDFYDKILNT